MNYACLNKAAVNQRVFLDHNQNLSDYKWFTLEWHLRLRKVSNINRGKNSRMQKYYAAWKPAIFTTVNITYFSQCWMSLKCKPFVVTQILIRTQKTPISSYFILAGIIHVFCYFPTLFFFKIWISHIYLRNRWQCFPPPPFHRYIKLADHAIRG